MTFEVETSNILAFVGGIIALWLKNYVGTRYKEKAKIEIKSEMLPELSKIENILTGAKIEGQLAKIDKLEEIAEAQARGQYSAEFEYYKIKEDSNKLDEFTEKVMKYTYTLHDYINNRNKEKMKIIKELNGSDLQTQELNLVYPESMEKIGQWIRETKIIYMLYFSKYNNHELDDAFSEWMNSNIYRLDSDAEHSKNFNNTIIKEMPAHDKKLELIDIFNKSVSDSMKFHDNSTNAYSHLLGKIEVFAGEISKPK